jgi:hypothetical protein
MKNIIRNILREEVEKNKNIERFFNPVTKYITVRSLPNFVCFTNVVKNEHHLIMVVMQYDKVVASDFEAKFQNELQKVFNTSDIWVTGFYGEEKNCKERLERLKNSKDYGKLFNIIPNKNYNP